MEKYISGSIRKVLFSSSSSNYKVMLFKIRETSDEYEERKGKTVVITGDFLSVDNELDYNLYGKFIQHARYGDQFEVQKYEVKQPSNTDEMIIYLSSGIFKGIGIKTAKRLVEALGDDTLELLRDKTIEIDESIISKRLLSNIRNRINEIGKEEETIMYLSTLGFSAKESLRLLSKYMGDLKIILEENIYLLKEDVPFVKLDEIYLRNNEEKSENRIFALIEYIIENICYKTGNTICNIEDVYITINKFLKEYITSDDFNHHINNLIKYNKVYVKGSYITLYDYYNSEKYISDRIKLCNRVKENVSDKKLDKIINTYEEAYRIEFNLDQINAIKGSIKNNFFIISGGPGTGKTTIVKAILNLYEEITHCNYTYDVALLAPTGRSAKRLALSTNIKASTIHKFLSWNKETKEFGVNENNKSNVKFVIIDESSMIDIFLMQSLLKALQDDVKILLVGDNNQLPSISPGNVLGDLIKVEQVNKCILNKIYRAKEGSYIIDFALDIKNQKKFEKLEDYDDFKYIQSSDIDVKDNLEQICNYMLKNNINLDDFQVLIPMYKGENGIDNINAFMQKIFNKKSTSKKEINIYDRVYRENDKVIQLVNDTDNNVFNGDIGYIKKIVSNELFIDYSGTIVNYKSGDYDKFTHAYAISIHKSQGSEYDYIVIILSNSFQRMLYNKLLYTAASRAKKKLYIIGTIENINKCINNSYSSSRKTLLKTFF